MTKKEDRPAIISNTNPQFIFTVGFMVLLSSLTIQVIMHSSPQSPLEQCNIKPSIMEMEWSPNAFVQAASTNRPIIFRGVPLNWKAKNWTWEYLSNQFKDVMIDVEVSNSPNMFYFDYGQTNLLNENSWLNSKIYDTIERDQLTRKSLYMNGSSFINQMNKPVVVNAQNNNQMELDSRFYYLTRSIKEPAGGEEGEESEAATNNNDETFRSILLKYFQPTEPFPSYITNDTFKSTLNIWMGGPRGTTTQSHYDEPHNMFVQLLGVKKFTLLPPCAIDSVYLYPDLHQRARKVQVPLNQLIDTSTSIGVKFSLFEKYILGGKSAAEAQSELSSSRVDKHLTHVYVRPGDVLYLPPFWMHRVTVGGDSDYGSDGGGAAASANIFIPSHVSSLYHQLIRSPLPFEDHMMQSDISVTAVHLWLTSLMKKLNISLRLLCQRLLFVRYKNIQLRSKYSYRWNDRIMQCAIVQKSDQKMKPTTLFGDMSIHVMKFANIAKQIQFSILWQLLQNYIELLMYNVMDGGINELRSYIEGCIVI